MKVRRGAALVVSVLTLSVSVGILSAPGAGASVDEAKAATGKALPAAELALVAYSTPTAAYASIIKAFQSTTAGKNITFTQSYGGSGDQARAVVAGQQADVVEFSLEPDMTKLVDAGIVAPTWNKNEYKGMVTDSVVVIGTRAGNPKKLKTWTDLTKSGVETITPNPFTSGGARWNVLAGYGAISNVNKDEQAGVDYLGELFKQVPVQDSSARESLQTFTSGKGDAILAYENEAILAKQAGQEVPYTIPDKTILIENPVAATKTTKYPKQAKAFVDFLYTKRAQQIFADNGYRPAVSGVVPANTFKTPAGLFTIDDLGGWTAINKKFFDPANSIMATVERSVGGATSK